MASELVKELVDAGIHFGHRTSRWNPKMKPYIFGKRNLIHVIDLKETLRGILLAKKFLARVVSQGKDVLFVGTKRQARKAVEEQADRCGMHYVNDRWLGGTLTNFREIRKRVARLDELEQLDADGKLDQYSKKEGASLRREMRKIRRNLGGIRKMERHPGALVIIDQKREIIGVREARKVGIPIVCLLDTDSDPDLVDIAIPGNDDAMRGIELIVRELADAITEGVQGRATAGADEDEKDQPRRRSRRPTTARAFEAEGEKPAPSAEKPAGAETPPPAETPKPDESEKPQPGADAGTAETPAPAPQTPTPPAEAPKPPAPAEPAKPAEAKPASEQAAGEPKAPSTDTGTA